MALKSTKAKFTVGQLVHHKLFDYRGVIVDVDPSFQGSEEWYSQMALSLPPKDQPWYHVLVHESIHRTYVAERNLETDIDTTPIEHPEIDDYFEKFEKGHYYVREQSN